MKSRILIVLSVIAVIQGAPDGHMQHHHGHNFVHGQPQQQQQQPQQFQHHQQQQQHPQFQPQMHNFGQPQQQQQQQPNVLVAEPRYEPQHLHLEQQQQQQQQQPGEPVVSESADVAAIVAASEAVGSHAGAGAWQEAASVGGSAFSNGLNVMSEMFYQLGTFQLLFIPAILLTGVYMLWVAYSSPYNAQSHYLVDAVPGHGGYGGHGGFYGPDKWRRSLNTFLGKSIEEYTPKVLDALKNFAAKYKE